MMKIKLNRNLGTQPVYTSLKGISLTQIRFMGSNPDREESNDLIEEDKNLKTEKDEKLETEKDEKSESEIKEKDSNNTTENNDSYDSDTKLESALIIRNEIRHKREYDSNGDNHLNRLVSLHEKYIGNYYNSHTSNIVDDVDRSTFDNDFACMLIESGNMDLVEGFTGINPYLLESDNESNFGNRDLVESNTGINLSLESDSDDGYHGGSELENNSLDKDSNTSDNDSEDNDSEDNSSEDNSSSGGESLPSLGYSPSDDSNSEESPSGSPSFNVNNSSDNNSERNYFDFFSFVIFQILNAFSFILDIITQIFLS